MLGSLLFVVYTDDLDENVRVMISKLGGIVDRESGHQ